MHHDEAQLDALWRDLADGDEAARQRLQQHYQNPHMPAAHPQIVCNSEQAQVLSVPSPDRARRHVYARRPGGRWVELA